MCIYKKQNVRNFAAEKGCYDIGKEELESVLKQWTEVFPSFKKEIDWDDTKYIEKFLGRLETDVAKIFAEIKNNPFKLYEEKSKILIAIFLYLLGYRNANYRESMSQSYNQLMDQMKERAYNDEKCRIVAKELGMSEGVKQYQFNQLFDMVKLMKFGQALIQDYSWYYGVVDGDLGLLTTDNPALNIILGLCDFCFPLTPRFALIFRSRYPESPLISPDLPQDDKISLSKHGVYNYNNINLRPLNPFRFVFGDINDLERQIDKRLIKKFRE